jgi:nucleoside diphosphate kinase
VRLLLDYLMLNEFANTLALVVTPPPVAAGDSSEGSAESGLPKGMAGPRKKATPRQLLFAQSTVKALLTNRAKRLKRQKRGSENSVANRDTLSAGGQPGPEEYDDDDDVEAAKKAAEPTATLTLALIKPDALKHLKAILARIRQEGFEVCVRRYRHGAVSKGLNGNGLCHKFLQRIRLSLVLIFCTHLVQVVQQARVQLSAQHVTCLYPAASKREDFPLVLKHLMTEKCLALMLKREPEAIETWKQICGPEKKAQWSLPPASNTLRALFATGEASPLLDAVHASASKAAAAVELAAIFRSDGSLQQSLFACVLPDVVASGKAVEVLALIKKGGFALAQQQTMTWSREQAKKFFESQAYDKNYAARVNLLCSGPLVALELRKEHAAAAAADVFGAQDPEVAQATQPDTIRALFGTNVVHNACYCSLDEKRGKRDLKLVFNVFAQASVGAVETTFAWLKPDANQDVEAIMAVIEEEGFDLVNSRSLTLNPEEVATFYNDLKTADFDKFMQLSSFMTSGPVVALALRRVNAVSAWRSLCGPSDAQVAKRVAPNSLRARFGSSELCNAVHAASTLAEAQRELKLAFSIFQSTAGEQTTFALIKPDAVASAESIKRKLQTERYVILQEKALALAPHQVARLYHAQAELPVFSELVGYLSNKTVLCLALQRENAVRALRDLCGPSDSSVARQTHPQSLRALFGTDRLCNAIHAASSEALAQSAIAYVFEELKVVEAVQRCFLLLSPDMVAGGRYRAVLATLSSEGFEVVQQERLPLDPSMVRAIICDRELDPEEKFLQNQLDFWTSGRVLALECRRVNGLHHLLELVGPEDPVAARLSQPSSLRALYGTDRLRNAVYCSISEEDARKDARVVFKASTAAGRDESLLLLHPVLLVRGLADSVKRRLAQEGFELLEEHEMQLTPSQVQQLFPRSIGSQGFPALVQALTAGPAACLRLLRNNAVVALRQLTGPESRKERAMEPQTLRAQFSEKDELSSLHCSVTDADAARELQLVRHMMNCDILYMALIARGLSRRFFKNM